MSIRRSSQRSRKKSVETNDKHHSAEIIDSPKENSNIPNPYPDVTNPLDIMQCRHPLEVGLKRSDIENPNNEEHNQNILKKMIISDSEFQHLCKTSSKYHDLSLTPIQKAITFFMVREGGCSNDEDILSFILYFWQTISDYNDSGETGSTGHKYRAKPTIRILRINYTKSRENCPLFVKYDDTRMAPNTIDGIKTGNIKSSGAKTQEQAKTTISTRRNKTAEPPVQNLSFKRKRKTEIKEEESLPDNEKSIKPQQTVKKEETQPKETEVCTESPNQTKEPPSKPPEIPEKTPPPPSSSRTSKKAPSRSISSRSNPAKKESPLFERVEQNSEGEIFQDLLMRCLKSSPKGMTLSEITEACRPFKFARGAYSELSIDRRVKSVLVMKKHLKEVDFNESTGKWSISSDNKGNFKADDGTKTLYLIPEKLKVLNIKELAIQDLWNILKDVGLY